MPEETATTSAEPTATGGDHGAPGGTAPTPSYSQPAPATPPASEPEKKYTDADVDRMQAKRAAEAKKAAEKAIADQLGVSIADAKKLIEERQAQAEAEKTEIQRAQERVADAERKAAEAAQAAARTARQSTIKEKLLLIGVGAQFDATDPEQLARKQKVIDAAQAIVERFAPADAVGDDLDEVIRENVLLVPGFVKDLSKPEPTPAPSGVTAGAQPPAGGQPGRPPGEAGRERARAVLARTQTTDRFARLRS